MWFQGRNCSRLCYTCEAVPKLVALNHLSQCDMNHMNKTLLGDSLKGEYSVGMEAATVNKVVMC